MRAFYTATDGCCELRPENFPTEDIQHKWVEANLHMLFPSLKLVEHKLKIAAKIPDTVAYDSMANTFVAIEYKNRRSDTVREQAEDYLNRMKDNRDTLVVTYNELPNTKTKRRDSFDWDKMYVVIIAPEFTDRQVQVANRRDTECLYEMRRFENGLVMLRFVGGGHDPIDAVKGEGNPLGNPVIVDPPGGGINIHVDKNPLYATLRDRILSAFQGLNEMPTKHYVGFGRDGETLLCTAEVQRSKIKVCYGRKNDITADEFVKDYSNIGHFGVGDYCSFVRNVKDIDPLLPILKQVDKRRRRNQSTLGK